MARLPSAVTRLLRAVVVTSLGAVVMAGCNAILGFDEGELSTAPTGSSATGGHTGPGGAGVGGSGGDPAPPTRVDVLLAVDGSRSMAIKQRLLASALPELVDEMVNPTCIDPSGQRSPVQPAGPLSDCPSGMERAFPPVVDMHVGVVTSNLGDHGGDTCPGIDPVNHNDDRGRLITRDQAGQDVSDQTYQALGFLAWDPEQRLQPPGESDVQAINELMGALVAGVGASGCGLEAQLESWYRFLVDPDPYLTIEEDSGSAVLSGTDQVLLTQRRDFLRPDSLLLVMVLSDENDCSIRDGGQYFYAARAHAGSAPYHLPRAQITCQIDPNDDCCRSCGQTDDGCPPKGPECDSSHDDLSDSLNLRCFNQKQRFGIDFLWPIDRYVTGLTSELVPDRDGNLVDNPIFIDLDPNDDITDIRDASAVFFAGIVGVPWQDIARRDENGDPNLISGLNANADPVGGYQNATELIANGTWDLILGDPSCYHTDPSTCLPSDPLMIESIDPRTGSHPITGDPIAEPTAGYMANSINGHERGEPLSTARNDLQYACIFPLDNPVDCSIAAPPCTCAAVPNDDPVCEDETGANGQTKYFATAYPGRRELELLQALGTQGIVASICPTNEVDPTRRDFGYRPAMSAIASRLQQALE